MKKRGVLIGVAILGVCAAAALVASGLRDRRPVLVCLGDSLTSCGGAGGHFSHWLQRFMPDVRVIDAGIGGDLPDVVLIALGANDFWRNMRPVPVLGDDLRAMVQEARQRGMQVVVASCFGQRDFWEEVCTEFDASRFGLAEEIARMERAVCDEYGCLYVPNMQIDVKPNRLPPFWDETDHPNRAGNEQVALCLLPALRQAVSRAAAE